MNGPLLKILTNSLRVTFFERKYIIKTDAISNNATIARGIFCKIEEYTYDTLLPYTKIYLYQQLQVPVDC